MRNGSAPFARTKIRDQLRVQIQLRIERESRLGAELHHAQDAAAAGGKVGWLDHILRVDREERQTAASQNGAEGGDQRLRLTPRRLVVDDDAARPLSGRAARAHDHRRKRGALQLHLLEQAYRQIGNLGDRAIGLKAAPGRIEDPLIFGALLVMIARELIEPFEQKRLLLGLPKRIGGLAEETLKHSRDPSVARSRFCRSQRAGFARSCATRSSMRAPCNCRRARGREP